MPTRQLEAQYTETTAREILLPCSFDADYNVLRMLLHCGCLFRAPHPRLGGWS